LTVAVQGFGNVGSHAAKILHDLGFKIIALSDVSGAIQNKNGIDPYKLSEFTKGNALAGYPEAEKFDPLKFFEIKCDILIPAALENQITEKNAANVKARIIAEGANAPTTPPADPILKDSNIFIIPDVLCNSGGVTVSYFEWVQGNDAYFWTKREVNLQLRDIMEKAFYEVYDFSTKRKLDMRNAALALAVGRVAQAMKLRGIYP
ncbi:MAG: Glu/Leu/Phe/Val family dehydrogenase, partial [Candidatus Humimicrobiaceae bacterium]